MKTRILSLSLALIAGILCLSAFTVKLIRNDAADYTILCAGLFIIALGVTAWFRKK